MSKKQPGALYLGLDIGTQGSKGLVLDGDSGQIVARAHASYGLVEGLPDGAAEQDPATWLEALDVICASLRDSVDLREIRSVAVSGQQHGFVPLDESGRVLRRAKLWCDTATIAEADELSEAWGRSLAVGFTASKILWLKRHEPELFAKLAHVALPHDYVNFVLTGRHASEYGDASGTGLLDPHTRSWLEADVAKVDEELLAKLPELLPAGEVFGTVQEAATQRFGLSPSCLVGVGGGDNMMAAIGAGAVEPGVTVLSLGTSGTVFARSEAPVVDPSGVIAPFCDSAGAWLPLLCVMNLTLVTEEVRSAFSMSHDEIAACARRVPVGADGLRMLPFLQGERVPPLPAAAGSLDGMRHGWLEPGRLYRAALEACVANLRLGSARLESLGIDIAKLRLVGGAAVNPLWQQCIADAFDRPVELVEESEAAAFGAALQALWTDRRREVPSLELAEVVRPHVRLGEGASPDASAVDAWGELLRDWRERLEQRYPGACA